MAGVRGRSGGHNAKTVKELGLQGSIRKHRHAHIRNPEPPSGIPVPPKRLEGDAAAEWSRMLQRLTTSKTLSTVDDAVLYQYCQVFAETEEVAQQRSEIRASIAILEENLSGLEREDLVAAFQEIGKMTAQATKCYDQILKGRMAQRVFLVEFGMTPASRGRVKLPIAAETKDPFDELESEATH